MASAAVEHLPSSPPILPSSPPLEQESLSSLPSPNRAGTPDVLLLPTASSRFRKRAFDDGFYSQSSDPVFSEDASDGDQPEAKRKRTWRGPWWQHSKQGYRVRTKGGPKRPVDSGVWLPSESSEMSFADTEFDQALPSASQRTVQSVTITQSEAEKIIWAAVEANEESIDLSDMNLEDIEDSWLKPLHQVIRSGGMDFEAAQRPLAPSLHLFLANNKLISLPAELHRLEHLVTLSVRGNRLSELPEWIARLPKLRELSIAGNDLSYLPYGLLQVLQAPPEGSFSLFERPNPLLNPFSSTLDSVPSWLGKPSVSATETDDRPNPPATVQQKIYHRMIDRHKLRFTGRLHAEKLVYPPEILATSAITFFDSNGSERRLQSFKPRREGFEPLLEPDLATPGNQMPSRVPSLFETSLRALSKSPFAAQIPALLQDDTPQSIINGVQSAITAKDCANICSVCQSQYVLKRAEWIEYWERGSEASSRWHGDVCLPFMRRACSWACARQAMQDIKERRCVCTETEFTTGCTAAVHGQEGRAGQDGQTGPERS